MPALWMSISTGCSENCEAMHSMPDTSLMSAWKNVMLGSCEMLGGWGVMSMAMMRDVDGREA